MTELGKVINLGSGLAKSQGLIRLRPKGMSGIVAEASCAECVVNVAKDRLSAGTELGDPIVRYESHFYYVEQWLFHLQSRPIIHLVLGALPRSRVGSDN